MTDDKKRIPISKEAFEAAKQAKKEKETWSEYVQRCAENPPQVQHLVDMEDLASHPDVELRQTTIPPKIDYDEIEDRFRDIVEENTQ